MYKRQPRSRTVKYTPVPTSKNSSNEFHRTSLNCSINVVNAAILTPITFTSKIPAAMRATYLLYYEFEVKSSVFVWRTHWQLCPVNAACGKPAGRACPAPTGSPKFAAKKFQKTPPVSQLGHNRVV